MALLKRYGYYEFLVMSFGLTNASDTFMDLMNRVFPCYIDSFFIIFNDDILVYCKNEVERIDHLKVVLNVLKENKLFAMFSKYKFWLRSVVFICHIISSEEVKVDPKKTEAVKNWPRTLTLTDIRS